MAKFAYVWNYMGRTVNEFFRSSRNNITLTPPSQVDQTISLIVSGAETVVDFSGLIQYSFNLDVVPRGSQKGDKLYLIMDGNALITSIGALNFNNCGPDSPPSEHELDGKTIIPLVYDGEIFYGLDYC